MIRIGLTGGAASGKSTVSRIIAEGLGTVALSADAIVAELLRSDSRVHEALTARYGSSILSESGVDRARLREAVFTSPAERKALEALLHPLVRESWLADLERNRSGGKPFFLVEIPLLFETGAQSVLDAIICVASSPAVQIERLCTFRGLSRPIAQGILDAQLSNEQRVAQSDLVIWNDGSLPALRSQAQLAISALKAWKLRR